MDGLARAKRVAGRDVYAFDRLVSDQESACKLSAISQAAFTQTERARGDALFRPVDAASDARELTAPWYCCERCHTELSGETLIYGPDGARVAAGPKPARLMWFDVAIRHAGNPANRNCLVAKYTFAIKVRAELRKIKPHP